MSENNTAAHSVTGNPERDNLIMIAILTLQQRGDDPFLLPSVQLELSAYPGFDLGADELAAMLDHLGIKPVVDAVVDVVQPVVDEVVDAVIDDAAADDAEPVPEVPEYSRDQVLDTRARLSREIAQARADLLSLGQAQHYARDVLGKAIQSFATGTAAQPTREECLRQVSETARAVKLGLIPSAPRPNRANGSIIDRMNGPEGGPGAAGRYAMKQMQRGYRRTRPGDVYDRTWNNGKGGSRPKLPSER